MAEHSRDPDALFALALGGDRSSLARLVSLVERGGDAARTISRLAYPRSGEAYTIGVTGAPGAGKSTLTNALIGHLLTLELDVAVLAIDPSSPFSGGAILGDRVRMQDHATDAGVFIRSMATRGHLGGLSLATPEAIRLLDAVGWRRIVVETVGVGQVEVDIAARADTTVVVVNPGWGDSVQASKAGLMEIADVFVINKADRAGVLQTQRDLEMMLDLSGAAGDGWRPPIVTTVATELAGTAPMWQAIVDHRRFMSDSGELEVKRSVRVGEELQAIVARRLELRARELCTGRRWEQLGERLARRDIDPWTAADEVLHPVGA